MKQLLALLMVAFAATAQAADSHAADVAKADEAKAKTKQVCKEVIGKDNKPVKNKDGSTKEMCKTIKVHKKHEGTEIPPKK